MTPDERTKVLGTLPPAFSYQEALDTGLTKHDVYALRDAGVIDVLARGLYRRTDAPEADRDLLSIALRAPDATLCLVTALARHGLADELTFAPDIAVPRGTRTPAVGTPVRWHRFDPHTFLVGRDGLQVDDTTTIGLYSAERSIVDAFRLRGTVGREVAHEALRRWLAQPGSSPGRLVLMARLFRRAEAPLRGALEVLQ